MLEEQVVYDTLSPYFARLLCLLRKKKEGTDELDERDTRRYPSHVSGFILSVRGEWMYVTAGHFFRSLQQQDRFAIEGWYFDDMAGNRLVPHQENPFNSKLLIPVSLKLDNVFFMDVQGFDAAFFRISDHDRRLLEGNDTKALDESRWLAPPPSEFDQLVMFGVPYRFSDSEMFDAYATQMVMYGVMPATDGGIQQFDRTKYSRLFGALPGASDPEGQPEDINGMSGGPVYAIWWLPDGRLEYRVVAIQSAWDKSTRTIAATPLLPLGMLIDKVFQRMIQQSSEEKR